jgi:hypothetical protein
MASEPLDRVRTICLALPEAHEVTAWGEPTFRVRNKLFAMYAHASNHHGAGRHAVWCKSDHTTQAYLVRSDPKRFFAPPYVGPSGWVGIWLDRRPSWKSVGEIVHDAWRIAAPKKLLASTDTLKSSGRSHPPRPR